MKGDGGAVGLTKNTSELVRWMVSGPEIVRVISEFQSTQELTKLSADQTEKDVRHQEVKGVQVALAKEVKNLCSTIEEMGNPFKESSEDRLVLDTHDILDPSVPVTIKNIVKNGKQQYVEERLEKICKSILDPIKSNKNYLFSCPPAKTASKEKQQIATLKQNCSLFAQLYVSYQVSEGDLDDFFLHKNHSCPSSFSQMDKLRSGCKSDLLHCLQKLCPAQNDAPDVDLLILDGVTIVNMMKPTACQTFQDYTSNIFIKYLENQLRKVRRIDIVWDLFKSNSLKCTTRSKRGKGIRTCVESTTIVPSNW